MARETRESSFDELAKGLASGTVSRGKALRWIGSALGGVALASVPGVAWATDCKPYGRRCTGDRQCCSRNCIRNPSGEGRICGCPTGRTRCGDRCVNLQRNENNCGSCGNRCAEEQECVSGACEGGGPAGCTPGTFGECGSCTHPDGTTAFCHCGTLADGTGTFCFFGGFCRSSCADCAVLYPGTVCVQTPSCNTGTAPVACVYPCSNGQPCPVP